MRRVGQRLPSDRSDGVQTIRYMKIELMTPLTRWLLPYICLAILAGLLLPASGAFPNPIPVPEGAHVALTFTNGMNFVLGDLIEMTKGKDFVLGDVIEMTFTLSNKGASTFEYVTGGDHRGTGFPTRYQFTVVDENGTALSKETRMDMGGMIIPQELKPGEQHLQRLRLQNYVRVDRPGVFTVHVVHDFGWKATRDNPLPVAEAKITIAVPTTEQAEKRVKAIASNYDPLKDNELGPYWSKTDFRYLSHPVYIPALEKQAAVGVVQATEGIQRIPTTNATLALVRLLDSEKTNVVHAAASFLHRRMPPRGPYTLEQVAYTNFWLPEAAEPLRIAAGKLLRSTNVSHVRTGAVIIKDLGASEDGALVLEALAPALREWQLREKPEDNLNSPGAGDPLIAALASLRERGYRAPKNGGLNVILARFLELADTNIVRGNGWEQTLEAFFTQNPPMLREAAVRALPRPPTGKWEKLLLEALSDRDRGVMRQACRTAGESQNAIFTEPLVNIVRTERHEWVVREAGEALTKIGAHWAAADAWLERLADEKLSYDALQFLAKTLERPKSVAGGGKGLSREDRVAMRVKWQHFFSDPERRVLVQSGKPVPVSEDQARDLLSGAFHFSLEDGGRWPALK